MTVTFYHNTTSIFCTTYISIILCYAMKIRLCKNFYKRNNIIVLLVKISRSKGTAKNMKEGQGCMHSSGIIFSCFNGIVCHLQLYRFCTCISWVSSLESRPLPFPQRWMYCITMLREREGSEFETTGFHNCFHFEVYPSVGSLPLVGMVLVVGYMIALLGDALQVSCPVERVNRQWLLLNSVILQDQ